MSDDNVTPAVPDAAILAARDSSPITPESRPPGTLGRGWRWPILLAILLAAAAVLASVVVGLRIVSDSASIEQLRAAAYRSCARTSVDRAFAQSFAQSARERRALQRRLPILDCVPNLDGHAPIVLSPREQDEFVRRYREGSLTRGEQGLCPISAERGPLVQLHC